MVYLDLVAGVFLCFMLFVRIVYSRITNQLYNYYIRTFGVVATECNASKLNTFIPFQSFRSASELLNFLACTVGSARMVGYLLLE